MAFNVDNTVFKALIENSSDMIAVNGPDFKILYVSPAYARVLGYAMDEVIGKTAPEFVHPDDLPKLKEAADSILAKPGASVSIHLRYNKKGGGSAYVDVVGTNCMHIPEISGIVVNAHDVTALVEAQLELKHKNEELERFTTALANRENKMAELKQELEACRSGK